MSDLVSDRFQAGHLCGPNCSFSSPALQETSFFNQHAASRGGTSSLQVGYTSGRFWGDTSPYAQSLLPARQGTKGNE